jgi:hypothetical protein
MAPAQVAEVLQVARPTPPKAISVRAAEMTAAEQALRDRKFPTKIFRFKTERF